MMERKTRMGRPREVKGGGTAMTFYFNQARIDDFRKLCDEIGISVSEGLRQLMEQELEKNEVGAINPTNIQYGLRQYKNSVDVTLEKFIDMTDARKLAESIPIENRSMAFKNTQKVYQQFQRLTTGKMTIL